MLANVFTKATRDNLPSGVVGAFLISLFLLFSLWVYRDIDTTFYYELPEGVLGLIGINPDGEGAGGIAFGAIYNMMGAFTVAGLAIGMGASSIAGEEQKGTLGFLLGNPISRHRVLLSKAISLVLVVGVMTVILWALGYGSAGILDVSTQNLHVGAITLALFANSLFYGFLAMAIGSWTGKRGASSAAAAALMIVGYLAASLLPLAGLEWLARIFPWYYFSAGAPINNGIDWAHTTVLAALTLASVAVAYIGVQRRDLREKGTNVTIVDRLRARPSTQKMMERIAGSTRVSRISVKTASEYQGLFTITAAIIFYMGLLIPPLYNFIPDDFIDIFSTFPDALVAMIGGVDMGTPTGFLTGEVFSLTAPITIIVLTVTIGSRALAGEEEKHTMGLLLSNPISRRQVVTEKVQAIVGFSVWFGFATLASTWIGVRLAGLDEVGIAGIASVSVLLTLFGMVYGALALLFSAATGRRGLSTMLTTGVAVVTWFMFSFFPLSETFEPIANISPFHWYLGSDPLLNGMDWSGAALLSGTCVVLAAASIPLFQRRDLRG